MRMRISSSLCFVVYMILAVTAAGLCHAAEPSAIERLDPNMAVKDATGAWAWYDAQHLTIEGKGWAEVESFYHRLPAKAKGVVRDAVWSLSTHSAGLCVRFMSDAPKIAARWTVASANLGMPHMPATGVSGLDLYVKDEAGWHWIANGRPSGQTTEATLAEGIPAGTHEYMLYLPLYNGTASVEIGVPPESALAKAPTREAAMAKPVVVYGTSITHGGCASRPGMAYPSILGRRLERPMINLGFSGNGTLDPEFEMLLAEIDAAAYVLDCLPNLPPERVTERTEPFVTALRAARPDTPIVLVENIAYQAGAFLPGNRAAYVDKNAALRAACDRLKAQGVTGLYYVEGAALLGSDGEATVDGTHPTDLGFLRMADVIEPVLRAALGVQKP